MKEILIVTSIGFISGLLLIIVDTFLNKKNKKLDRIIEMLPGYNCGACGFGSCEGYALAIKNGKIEENKCRILAQENLQKLKKFFK